MLLFTALGFALLKQPFFTGAHDADHDRRTTCPNPRILETVQESERSIIAVVRLLNKTHGPYHMAQRPEDGTCCANQTDIVQPENQPIGDMVEIAEHRRRLKLKLAPVKSKFENILFSKASTLASLHP